MLTLLTTLVVSQTEYCSLLWSPTDTRNIALLERAQRRFKSKFAVFQSYGMSLKMPICVISYEDRLKRLKIYSLERRRERYMIIYVYKIVIGLVPNPGLEWTHNERTKIKVKPSHCHSAPAWVKTIRDRSFYFRGPRLYNTLPTSMRELGDMKTPTKKHVEQFKVKLDEYLSKTVDKRAHLRFFTIPKTKPAI